MGHDLIHDNPRLKGPIVSVLGQFSEQVERRRAEVEEALASSWDEGFAHTPAVVIDILVRDGSLTERVFVDGEPYGGSLEDAMVDDAVPNEAEAWSSLGITERGAALLADHEPAHALSVLFEERPQHADAFRAALWACSNEQGCSRADIERQINEVLAQQGSGAGGQKVYPQYFIDALETAGGIAWSEGAWRITQAGRQAL